MTGLAARLTRAETRAWRRPACGVGCACRRDETVPTVLDHEIDALLTDAAARRALELVDAAAADPRAGLTDAQQTTLRALAAEALRAPGGKG